MDTNTRTVFTAPDGTFDLLGLSPGKYRINAVPAEATRTGSTLGFADVTVGASDIDGFRILLEPQNSYQLEGQLDVEAPLTGGSAPNLTQLSVRLQSDYGKSSTNGTKPDGRFTLSGT
jgi:hypothetical protein